MLRRERVQRLAMGAISASSTIRSVPQPGRRVVRAKPRLVKLFLELARTMARQQDKVVVHPTPTGIIPASANATTTITAPVVVRTLTSRPVALAVGGRVDGAHGVRAVLVVAEERRPARIAVMVRCKHKPAIPKSAADGARGRDVRQAAAAGLNRERTVAMALPKPNLVIRSPADVRLVHGQRAVPVAAAERALVPTRARPAG
jgi:hypothetical protein